MVLTKKTSVAVIEVIPPSYYLKSESANERTHARAKHASNAGQANERANECASESSKQCSAIERANEP